MLLKLINLNNIINENSEVTLFCIKPFCEIEEETIKLNKKCSISINRQFS